MSSVVTTSKEKTQDFEVLRQYISDECAICIPPEKSHLFEARLKSLLSETNSSSYTELYQKTKDPNYADLREQITDAITTDETLWFRDTCPWVVIEEHLLPKFAKRLQEEKAEKIRVWSAACSTGQEPYSLAMLVDKMYSQNPKKYPDPEKVEIYGSDISPSALYLAISGRYDSSMVGRLAESYRKAYFEQSGNNWKLDNKIKERVKFNKLNLHDDFSQMGKFDLIFCRNVAIYYKEDYKKDLFSRMYNTLTDEGAFFLGASESLLGLTDAFEAKTYNDVYYYIKKKG